ncbi:MAG TPA: sensor domain-containing diguanylate cyclase [Dissulfurispiraceae bacterium]|nr:sensor domain-containing diguanylate cyclase [Dissulfurispiraceae bacterium]
MANYVIDAEMLAKAFDSLSEMTGLSFSLYDDRQSMLIPPSREDVVLEAVRSHSKGSQLLSSFLSRMLAKVLTTNETVVEQGPSDQYHVFIPIRSKGMNAVVVADAFYIADKDYIDFFVKKGVHFGISYESVAEHLMRVRVIPLHRVQEIVRNVRPLLDGMLATGHEKNELKRQSHWMRVISGLVAGVRYDMPLKDLYKRIIEAATFVFAIESAAVFIKKEDSFPVESTSGRKHAFVDALQLKSDNQLVARVLSSKEPLSVIDAHELLHAGFDDEILSMYLFPICTDKSFFGIIGVFNTLLEKYAFDSISDLCRLLANVFESRSATYGYYARYEMVKSIFEKTAHMVQHCSTPEELYEHIVDEAARVIKVEKCSLMLPTDDGLSLSVAAVRGTMKELMMDVFVRAGEGIAGTAYKSGKHILINTDDELKLFAGGGKPSFKTPSCLSLPIASGDDVIGVLNMADKIGGKSFTNDDVTVLGYFLSQMYILLKLAAQHEQVRKMKDAAFVDPVTDLFNRRYFEVRIEEEFKRSKRHSLPFSLALMRLDGVRQMTGGRAAHARSLDALRQAAMALKNAVRINDVLVRFGEDEFALIMPQAGMGQALAVMERVRTDIRQIAPPSALDSVKHVTMSIGVATYPVCNESATAIVRAADKAMYQAVSEGCDRVVLWQSPDAGINPSLFRQDSSGGKRGGFVIPAD